ncbi:MAG: hypothetical protein A2287_05950 [Candidatus Melainabacteria bacterium RIFOXYA12_FULL_32_12]|nr:MAG: hypothetical protein A2255_03025 [Candidatus Melainabacteria bacterium RIFOXYA2_FULL_32_9]OGI30892.1 MAG: hypothetical protein A2287_05950 [Candidatus Melainabacteria bacterium RIFOXYA12_FULL_32_12]
MKQAIELIQSQNYIEALNILNKLIKNEPSNWQALSEAGFCHIQVGELIKAQDKFDLASQFNPEDPWIWQQYSYVLFQLGKVSGAISALRKAVKSKPYDIMINYQLAFLYFRTKDFSNSLKYVDKAIELSNASGNHIYINDLLGMKAMIYENTDHNKAIEVYFTIFKTLEDDACSYDKFSSLIIDRFEFSSNLTELNTAFPEYNEATQLFRSGDLDNAINLYKKVIKEHKFCYPAYLGLAQALYEKRFSTRDIGDYNDPAGISKLFKNYEQLNKTEKNIIIASVLPFENFIPIINSRDSHFVIAPIDTKLTDYPANQYLKNRNYLENISYCSLRGIGGDNAYVGIERLRDFLWEVPQTLKFIPACVAHEFAHLVWCSLDKNVVKRVEKLYKQAKMSQSFISNYSSENVQEYFAEYYALYARLLSSNAELPENDPMIGILEELKRI